MVEQAAYNSDFLATFPLYYRDSPVPRRKRRRRKRRILFSKRKRSFVDETHDVARVYRAYDTYEGREGEEGGERFQRYTQPATTETGNEWRLESEGEEKKYTLHYRGIDNARGGREGERAEQSTRLERDVCIHTRDATKRRR